MASSTGPRGDPKDPDPWGALPGGNPFGPGGPFGGGDPFSSMDAWLRQMGIDPSDFRKLAEEMQRNLQDALRNVGQEPGRSFVSGFSVRVGPDGKPTFSSFGNKPHVKPSPGGGLPAIRADEREPLTDVIEDRDFIAITMEMPGVTKQDINLRMGDDTLEIAVDTERRKYSKRVRLPAKVEPKTTKATYNNGVLDVTVQKARQDRGGVQIAVE